MAIVKTAQKSCPAGVFVMKIACNSNGFFSAKLPPYYAEAIAKDEVHGQSLKECEQAFDEATKLFKLSKSTTRKVIAYKVRPRDDHWPAGIELGVAVEIYEEKTFEAEGKITIAFKQCASKLPSELRAGSEKHGVKRGSRVIEWTPEREAFFCELAKRLDRIRQAIEMLDKRDGAEKVIDGITPLVALMEATQ